MSSKSRGKEGNGSSKSRDKRENSKAIIGSNNTNNQQETQFFSFVVSMALGRPDKMEFEIKEREVCSIP